MADTKIKAGQFFGVIGHGTDGYFLMTNADGSMSWSQASTGPSVTSVTYPGDDTAADPAGDQTVILTGTNFGSSMTVSIGGTTAPSVAHDSSTQLTITTPAKAAGDYDIVVTNTVTGASGTFVNGISYNGVPTWTTATGSLGTFESETTISTITLQATEPDGGTITFNITNGALPSGLSLTGANIDGTTTAESSTTLYSFTIEAIDDENQSTPRNFSITVNAAAITNYENFTVNTYTGNGSTQSIEGKIGTAAQFNGINSRLQLNQNPSTSSLSFSAWVYFNNFTNAHNIIGNVTGAVYAVGWALQLQSNGKFILLTDNDTSANWLMAKEYNNTPLNANQWYHIALVSNGSANNLYIDGTEITNVSYLNGSQVALINGSNNLEISYGGSTRVLNGKIDQVRIFNKAISSSEVTTIYGENNASSTKSTTDIFADGSGVALYEFEEGAKDTGGVTGYIGGGGIFNGSSSKIDLPSFGNTFENNFSYSLWFVLDSSPSGGISALITTQGDYYNFAIIRDSDKKVETRFEYPGGGSNILKSTSTFTDYGTWHHLTITKSSTNGAAIYIDGTLEASDATATSNLSALSSGNTLGVYGNGIQYWLDGKIDQVRFFNKALSSSEVTTLYQETSASATKSTTDIFDDNSGVALYELERNANDTGGSFGSLVTGSKIDLDVDGYTSGSVADLSGNGNTATVTGATYGTDPSEGGYFDLDGSGDYLTISSSTDFQSTSNFTFEIWMKPNVLSNYKAISNVYSVGTASNRKWVSTIDSDGDIEFVTYSSGGGTVLTGNNPSVRIQTGVWNHIVLVYNQGVNQEIFINGVSHANTTPSTTIQTGGSAPMAIGTYLDYPTTYDFDGKVGDVRFYDSALTSSQIVENFNASKGEYGVGFDGTATNVSYAYDGTPTNVSFVGTSFQPDLVWVKTRTQPYSNSLFDSIRGTGTDKQIYSDEALEEGNRTDLTNFVSFDTNGFTVGATTHANNILNKSGEDLVAWCWKAGGSVTPNNNTVGDITSTVSANQDAGFSIVKYTGNQTASQTIGHGLSSAPELLIVKNIDASDNWAVYSSATGNANKLLLNSTAASSSSGNWNSTTPTNSVFTISANSEVNQLDDDFIAYCFHSVDGYQKVGSYSGNSSVAITVTTGFKPRFLMLKLAVGTSSAYTGWVMFDYTRDIDSDQDNPLYANAYYQEGLRGNGTGSADDAVKVQFTDTGFIVDPDLNRDGETNAGNGTTYIYLAIA